MDEQIIFTGNCYWCLEAILKASKGITNVVSGMYLIDDYEFAFGKNDKLEAVCVNYDSTKISLDTLFDIYYIAHTPTLNKWDKEDCFFAPCRPAVFYSLEHQKTALEIKIKQLTDENVFDGIIQTKIAKLTASCFTLVDEINRNYFEKNSKDAYCTTIIQPKLDKLKIYMEKL